MLHCVSSQKLLIWNMPSLQELQWMEQWRFAEQALKEQKKNDLAQLDEDQARKMSYSLLSLASRSYMNPSRIQTSGLVEQQKWFGLWKD